MLAPVATIVPSAVFPPATPFTSQSTLAPCARQKEALNACVAESGTIAEGGEIALVSAQIIVTLALAVFDPSATLVAVTVTVAGEGISVGAV